MPQIVEIEFKLENQESKSKRRWKIKEKEKEEAMGAEDQSEMRGTAEQAPGASLHL
jgi:hypothetical protein